jgi:thiamine-phosphate pyrophosphorylase
MSLGTDLGSARRTRLAAARLYLVCDSKPGGRELPDVLRAAIAGGVDVVQLRDKHSGDVELAQTARAAGELCRRLGALLIVNDRPQIAVQAGADGVHVGQNDTPLAAVRKLVGPDALVGLSTHAPAEIDAVDGTLVDYIGVGPVHATPTKPGRPAVGLELIGYAADHASVPYFAIGGIEAGNVAAVVAAGARRIAVVRAIAAAADPGLAARTLRATLDARRPEVELAAR